jgi:F-type H+-transporting ATPase subunit gamma
MPQNLRTTRRKIRAITSIGHITRAMKMVATAKLRRVQGRVQAGRMYAERLSELVAQVAGAAGEEFSHPYIEPRPEIRSVGLLLVAGDKGLCGSYNTNLLREATAFLKQQTVPVKVVTVSSKASRYAVKHGLDLVEQFGPVAGKDGLAQAAQVARTAQRLYETERIDALYVVYTSFISIVRQRPTVRQLLPIVGELTGETARTSYLFEPPAPELLGRLLPQAIESEIIQMLLESEAAEQAARMSAMTAATDSAQDMVKTLTRGLNRARQFAITAEMLEIIGGANALGGRS